ncbi:hypothetical protein NP493_189g05042 [Ridgeia piscesae]|uniref:Uncharacterized protein n=1 Tax=Ridgeia piscesae TaxID=27915 RepID=A0AAD9P2F5_RIDPI|nr:hypothetical protein NP493_189g05042 [Ridgeia piscesae]
MNNIDNYHLVLLQAESAINRRASDMIESINKQKADLLDQLHHTRDQKLENLQTNDHYIQEAQHVQQDVLRTTETATQAQMLAHRDMHALTLVSRDNAFVQFQAAIQDPVIGKLEGT